MIKWPTWFKYLVQSLAHPECLSCHSILIRKHLLCDRCFQKRLGPHLQLKKRVLDYGSEKITHYYLFDWPDTDDKFYSAFAQGLKVFKAPLALVYYSEVLASELLRVIQHQSLTAPKLILSAPGSKWFSVHSAVIGQSLGCALSAKHAANVFKKVGQTSQKNLTKTLRDQVVVTIDEAQQYEQITAAKLENSELWLVDDIVTTGATIKACLRALGRARHLVVVSIFYRGPAR